MAGRGQDRLWVKLPGTFPITMTQTSWQPLERENKCCFVLPERTASERVCGEGAALLGAFSPGGRQDG